MPMIRIEQALAVAKENGRKIAKKDIAAMLWPNATQAAQQVNMTNLCSGKTSRIDPDWVPIICRECGVSADFLFNVASL